MKPEENLDPKFETLLEYLRQNRGFDFTGYKHPSLMRRIGRRMQSRGITSFPDYVDYLEVHPEEFSALFNSILINVTSFFRDPAAWACLEQEFVPRLLAGKAPNETIRIWSGGCASGEEVYTIAMIFCEVLGRDEFKRRIKIYATDADEETLTVARQATYGTKDVQPVPEKLREKYFEQANGRFVFSADLRRSVIFGRHDLVHDAAISRLDLLVCRNVLMYFNAETQARILSRFNYALNSNGGLFLGNGEMLIANANLFAPLESKHRIFCKRDQVRLRDRLAVFAPMTGVGADLNAGLTRYVRLRDANFELAEVPQVLVDANGILLMANQQVRQVFDVDAKDAGRPFREIELSYRPVELRSVIEQANAERKMIRVGAVERRQQNGVMRYLDVRVMPLMDHEAFLGVCVTFKDVTDYHELQEGLLRARQEPETINQELQSPTKSCNRPTKLQSTNEELQSTNEELQSTNEELETMNEELQSTNEELQTINEELRQRTDQLNESNSFLNSILSSLRGAVVVVDRNFNVLVWNHMAENLWGLRPDEVRGESLLKLDIGLPVGQLRNAVRASMNDGAELQEMILNAVNRRGRSIKCRVTVSPCKTGGGEAHGAVIMMEEMGM